MAKDFGGLLALIGEALRDKGTPLEVAAREACGCGCGQPAGLEFSIADRHVRVIRPEVADQLIDGLAEMRAKLWGPRDATAATATATARDGKGAADVRRN